MSKNKLYLFGIIDGISDKKLDISDWSTPVQTRDYKQIAIVYTKLSTEKNQDMLATRKNLLAHEKVIEMVMKHYTILPFSFGTILNNFSEMDDFIEEHVHDFSHKLESIRGKIELNLKGIWNDMQPVYENILETHENISQLKILLEESNSVSQNDKVALGKLVEAALISEKESKQKFILSILSPYYINYKLNKTTGDNMFCNIAFLVAKEKEEDFDRKLNELDNQIGKHITWKYVGPIAPYNFI